MKENFRAELAKLINRESMENGSNTPDFILAEYLTDCLDVYDRTVRAREKWYGREPVRVPSYEAPAPPHIPRSPDDNEWRCMVCNIKLEEGDYHVTIMRGDKTIRYCALHAPAMTTLHLPLPAPEQVREAAAPAPDQASIVECKRCRCARPLSQMMQDTHNDSYCVTCWDFIYPPKPKPIEDLHGAAPSAHDLVPCDFCGAQVYRNQLTHLTDVNRRVCPACVEKLKKTKRCGSC